MWLYAEQKLRLAVAGRQPPLSTLEDCREGSAFGTMVLQEGPVPQQVCFEKLVVFLQFHPMHAHLCL
jgi:hypothetical protein